MHINPFHDTLSLLKSSHSHTWMPTLVVPCNKPQNFKIRSKYLALSEDWMCEWVSHQKLSTASRNGILAHTLLVHLIDEYQVEGCCKSYFSRRHEGGSKKFWMSQQESEEECYSFAWFYSLNICSDSIIFKVKFCINFEKYLDGYLAVAEWLVLLRIREVRGSNFGLETGYPEIFRGFPKPIQGTAGIVP
jgi:hypothetical protein